MHKLIHYMKVEVGKGDYIVLLIAVYGPNKADGRRLIGVQTGKTKSDPIDSYFDANLKNPILM